MSKPPQDLLSRPPEEAARLLALAFLDEVSAARQRLKDPADAEALHDCRVGLRRLRSCLRAFRAELNGSVSKRMRNSLREIATSTNAGRDAEVQLEWLQTQRTALPGRQRSGLTWLVRRLEDRKRQEYAKAVAQISRELERLEEQMRRRIPVYATQVRVDRPKTSSNFAATASKLVREQASELQARLKLIRAPEDEAEGHEARISAKRLRYLLEPLCDHVEGCVVTVKRLKKLQDVLGQLHDTHVLSTEVASALEVAAAEKARRLHDLALRDEPAETEMRSEMRRDERPGLIALAKLLRARRSRLYANVRSEWLEGGADTFMTDVAALADDLASRSAENVQIERKYLLRRLPDVVAQYPAVEIEQGWLPGHDLQERLRRTRAADGERFFRTVKLGSGLERLEVEDETSRELFERLWPLTAGKRLRKRRHTVPAGDLVWKIDAFLDRDLVIAEVELESRDTRIETPAWMEPLLVREVTADPAFSNVNLAGAFDLCVAAGHHGSGAKDGTPRTAG